MYIYIFIYKYVYNLYNQIEVSEPDTECILSSYNLYWNPDTKGELSGDNTSGTTGSSGSMP